VFTARYRVNPQIRSSVADLSVRMPSFDSRALCVKFVVDIVARGLIFIRVLQLCFVCIIAPMIHSLYHLNVPLTRRRDMRTRGIFKKAVFFRKSGNIGQTSTSTSVAALGAVDCLYGVCRRRFLPSCPWARTVSVTDFQLLRGIWN